MPHRLPLRARFLAGALACAVLPAMLHAQQSPASAPLRPGDRILVRIWADSAFADSARVDQQGDIVLPLIGRLRISGLSAPAIIDSVRSAYSRSIRGTGVEVTPLRRVTMSGELRSPGIYFVDPHITLREVIAMAGGITEIGSTGKLAVSRDGARLEVRDWERRADDEVLVRSGDVIWVGRQPWLKRNALSAISALGVLLSVVVALAR